MIALPETDASQGEHEPGASVWRVEGQYVYCEGECVVSPSTHWCPRDTHV